MRLPVIHGLIRRRLLINFRVDAEVMGRSLPRPFRPKLHAGYSIAGICLIRLEQIRPGWLPRFCGISSENAAHRIAVLWDEPDGQTREGVYIPRRDTGSWLNHAAGGRLFPGEHQRADFDVKDDGKNVALSIKARDGKMTVEVRGKECDALPEASCFQSLEDTSKFFEGGSIGYSVTRDCCRLDGLRLDTETWGVRPLAMDLVNSSFFSDVTAFPPGSAVFDHALIMRNIQHRWTGERDLMTVGEDAPKEHGVEPMAVR